MFKNDLLKDRGIFLSGGGSGLGRSMALHFATSAQKCSSSAGARIRSKETCDAIREAGGQAAYSTCERARTSPQSKPPPTKRTPRSAASTRS